MDLQSNNDDSIITRVGQDSGMAPNMLTNSYSIFQEHWWLDAVAPGAWSEVIVRKGDEIVARLPYVLKTRMGLRILTQPQLTPALGPWLKQTSAKYAKQLSDEKEMLSGLIEQLPKADLFRQSFAPQVKNWLPFYWAGYRISVSCTYRINNLMDSEGIWKNLQSNIKTDVQKAKKILTIRDDLGVDNLLDVISMTFKRQNSGLPYPRELIYRIDEACQLHKSSKMLFAQDGQNRIHAVAYIIWDSEAAYYLCGGGNPELRNSGATSLLLWHAIQHASTVTKAFDFEGSRVESIERFFRAFGGQQTSFYSITKSSRRMKALFGMNDIFAALTGYESDRLKSLNT